jgi:HlyD family secretion protein
MLLAGCSAERTAVWQGYIEGDYVRVASPLSGTLVQLWVRRGDAVSVGADLFLLERTVEEAALQEAIERLAQARSRLDDLHKGRRPSELAALEARLAQAQTVLDLAVQDGDRIEALFRDGAVARAELDRAAATRAAARDRVTELEHELVTARLGGREDAVRVAEAEVSAAESAVLRSRWAVDEKQRRAPVNARVQDTFYQPGEWVPAGAPVLSLLPPAGVKVRFFVQEPELGTLRVGEDLEIHIDGLAQPRTARVEYVAARAEFTPPVIYSRENRAKLVFMVEAGFVDPDPAVLHPGQPVEVRRPASAGEAR